MITRKVIATIKLAPGQVGYYDEYSRIYLTIGRPTAKVYAGTNCSQLKRSLRSGRIKLVDGSLGENRPPYRLIPGPNCTYTLVSNDIPTLPEEIEIKRKRQEANEKAAENLRKEYDRVQAEKKAKEEALRLAKEQEEKAKQEEKEKAKKAEEEKAALAKKEEVKVEEAKTEEVVETPVEAAAEEASEEKEDAVEETVEKNKGKKKAKK